MREVNKDLKLHQAKLQRRIDELEGGSFGVGGAVAPLSKRNRRYDGGEEEEREQRSRETASGGNGAAMQHGHDQHQRMIEAFVHASHAQGGEPSLLQSGDDGCFGKENKRTNANQRHLPVGQGMAGGMHGAT